MLWFANKGFVYGDESLKANLRDRLWYCRFIAPATLLSHISALQQAACANVYSDGLRCGKAADGWSNLWPHVDAKLGAFRPAMTPSLMRVLQPVEKQISKLAKHVLVCVLDDVSRP